MRFMCTFFICIFYMYIFTSFWGKFVRSYLFVVDCPTQLTLIFILWYLYLSVDKCQSYIYKYENWKYSLTDSLTDWGYFYFWHTKSDPWDLKMTMKMTMTVTMRMTMTMTMTSETSETYVKTILQTCDNWDTGSYSYNWEPEFMTIFVTWQSRVTLDSIRNSCDV